MHLINWGPSVNVEMVGIICTASFLNPSLSLLYLRFGPWWKLKGKRWPGRPPSVWPWMASWSERWRWRLLVWRNTSMLLFHTTCNSILNITFWFLFLFKTAAADEILAFFSFTFFFFLSWSCEPDVSVFWCWLEQICVLSSFCVCD